MSLKGLSGLSGLSALAGGGSVFLMTSIANLELWLEADDIEGLANNDPVTTWEDMSGNGRHFTQATGANKPRFISSAQGGKPGVDFSEDNQRFLSRANFASGFSTAEIFVLYKQIAASTNTGLWSFNVSGGGEPFHPFNNDLFYEGWGTGTRQNEISALVDPKTTYRLYNVLTANNNFKIRQNNSQMFSNASNTVAFDENPKLGNNGNPNGGNCIILALAMFSRALDVTERQQITSFWNNKYTLSIPNAS